MKYIECPDEWVPSPGEQSIFLAGGISSCDNWQPQMAELLKDTDLTVVNPRRKSFDVTDPKMTEIQINWEHRHLKRVSQRLFWFPSETLCPITLFEYGKFLMSSSLFVGTHPEYKRRLDLEIQTALERPDIEIVYSLSDLAEQVIAFTQKFEKYRKSLIERINQKFS